VSGLQATTKELYPSYIGEHLNITALVLFCFLLFVFVSCTLRCLYRCCGFPNDSPSAQKEYTNLLLCGFVLVFCALGRIAVGRRNEATDDTPTDRGETDFGGLRTGAFMVLIQKVYAWRA
jgi:hypothetical protein